MALASLCEDSEWGLTWRDVLQHRFEGQGELDNHALGNLLILALWQLLGDEVAGLDWVGRLLTIHGRVVPMSSSPLVIEADIVSGGSRRRVSGQVAVASARGRLENVGMVPQDAEAHPEALRAIDEAGWVVLGPGSWYTSVLPHLILPSMRRALVNTSARKVVVLNLSAQQGETDGMTSADHLRVLSQYAPDLRLDVVLADPSTPGSAFWQGYVRTVTDKPWAVRGAALLEAGLGGGLVGGAARPGRSAGRGHVVGLMHSMVTTALRNDQTFRPACG